MSKLKLKKELLRTLRDDIRAMIREDRYSNIKPQKKELVKATIVGDSKEDVIEGAKKLPKIMNKADEFMKARLGNSDIQEEVGEEDSKKKKKK